MLSMLVPGLGHLILGARRRALVLLGLTGAIALASVALVLAHPTLDARLLVWFLALDVDLVAVVGARPGMERGRLPGQDGAPISS